jgi:hypothetical protein
MADITETQVRQFIAEKLPSESDIPAVDHRAVENKIMDFVVQELAKVAKSKELPLESFTTDRNYSVATGLPSAAVIDSVIVMLVCKTANNGFSIGDTVTGPTPYPQDSGRTSAQGIGAQYNNFSNSTIKVMVNDQIAIMTAYNGTANWSIKLIVGYK